MNSVTPSTTPRIRASMQIAVEQATISPQVGAADGMGAPARACQLDQDGRRWAAGMVEAGGQGRAVDPGQDVREDFFALVVAQQQVPAVEIGGDAAVVRVERRHEAARRRRLDDLVARARAAPAWAAAGWAPPPGFRSSGRPGLRPHPFGCSAGRAGHGLGHRASRHCRMPARRTCRALTRSIGSTEDSTRRAVR